MSEPNSPDAPDATDAKRERDPLDELLRGTMRALEAQTPPSYFEALPRAIDAAIDAGAGVGEEDVELAAEAGGRARRSSAQGLELGARDARDTKDRRARRSSAGELRKTPSTSMPPISATAAGAPAGPLAAPVREGGRARTPSDSRAYRRSLLETQVGAPQAWWQTRAAALAVLGVAVCAAIALIVLRRGDGDSSEDQLGASSSRMHELPRSSGRPVRVTMTPDAAPPLTAEQAELRDQLAGALPTARACVGARPLDAATLTVTLEASGAVAAVAIEGAAAVRAAEACIAKAVRDAAASGAIGAGAARTVTIPLFE